MRISDCSSDLCSSDLYTNMRKGFPSLSLQVQEVLRRDPLSGHLFSAVRPLRGRVRGPGRACYPQDGGIGSGKQPADRHEPRARHCGRLACSSAHGQGWPHPGRSAAMTTVARRTFSSTPQRDAHQTWTAIVDLLTQGNTGAARSDLLAVSGVAASVIADQAPKDAPIVVTCDGPRTRIYCLYDDDALEDRKSTRLNS